MNSFDNISEDELENILHVLLVLAKRKDPNVIWWTNPDYATNTAACNICNSTFNLDINSNEMYDHMFFHLKEYNLMVFL